MRAFVLACSLGQSVCLSVSSHGYLLVHMHLHFIHSLTRLVTYSHSFAHSLTLTLLFIDIFYALQMFSILYPNGRHFLTRYVCFP